MLLILGLNVPFSIFQADYNMHLIVCYLKNISSPFSCPCICRHSLPALVANKRYLSILVVSSFLYSESIGQSVYINKPFSSIQSTEHLPNLRHICLLYFIWRWKHILFLFRNTIIIILIRITIPTTNVFKSILTRKYILHIFFKTTWAMKNRKFVFL